MPLGTLLLVWLRHLATTGHSEQIPHLSPRRQTPQACEPRGEVWTWSWAKPAVEAPTWPTLQPLGVGHHRLPPRSPALGWQGCPQRQDLAGKQIFAFTCSCSHQSVPGSSAAFLQPGCTVGIWRRCPTDAHRRQESTQLLKTGISYMVHIGELLWDWTAAAGTGLIPGSSPHLGQGWIPGWAAPFQTSIRKL